MRFLSLSRPWPWAIFDPIARKHTEFRNWMAPMHSIGEQFAIQVAESWDKRATGIFLELGLDHFPMRYDGHPYGIIQGVVTLDRVLGDDPPALAPDQMRWAKYKLGQFAWCLSGVTPLTETVKFPGAQGLRILPPDVSGIATDPKDMAAAAQLGLDIVGPNNDVLLKRMINQIRASNGLIMVAWGVGADPDRARHVHALAGEVYCLKTNKDGSPVHPLYQPGDLTPQLWTGMPA